MRNSSDTGRAVTVVGASLFLVATAALSFSLYGENPGKTRPVILMVLAVLSALVLFIGQYLLSADANRDKKKKKASWPSLASLPADRKHEARE